MGSEISDRISLINVAKKHCSNNCYAMRTMYGCERVCVCVCASHEKMSDSFESKETKESQRSIVLAHAVREKIFYFKQRCYFFSLLAVLFVSMLCAVLPLQLHRFRLHSWPFTLRCFRRGGRGNATQTQYLAEVKMFDGPGKRNYSVEVKFIRSM